MNVDINPPSSEVCSYLKNLGIHLHISLCPRGKKFRKYRAGRHIAINHFRTIEVVCNSFRTSCGSVSRSVNVTNLIDICPLSVIRNEAKHLTVAYLMPNLYASLKNALAFVTLSVMLMLTYFL